MSALVWVLAGLVAYTLVAMVLRQRGLLPSSVRLQGPLTTVHTRRGRAFLDWLARPRRFWRAWSNVGLGVTLVVMVGVFLLFLYQGVSILRNPPPPTAVNQPRNFLVIPGVNEFLPLSVAPEIVFGLLVGLVVHEGGHGLLCRVEDIDIESMGLVFLAVVPVGAFVEPAEESQREADRGSRSRMFAAGVTNNFAVTVVAFVLLFGPVVGAITLAPGVAIAGAYDGTPAAAANVTQGDRVTQVAGQPVTTEAEMDAALAATPDRTVAVELNGDRTVQVERSLVVVGTIQGNPANLTVEQGEPAIRVQAVNGTPVATRSEFREAVGEDTYARLQTSAGETTIPVGVYVVRATPDRPLEAAGAPTDRSFIVTSVAGERVVSASELSTVLDSTREGEEVVVEALVDGERERWTVTLDENPQDGNGFLGVNLFPGTSGLVLTDFGTEVYPAPTYLELLGGDAGPGGPNLGGLAESPLALVYVALVLPLASFVLGIPNFPGFTAEVANFYAVTGPLAILGEGGVFLLANALFWTAWINLQLGLFNCIPGYPLDGGRIMRMGAEAAVARLPVPNRHRIVRTITTGVGLTMLASLLLLLFGPQLLG